MQILLLTETTNRFEVIPAVRGPGALPETPDGLVAMAAYLEIEISVKISFNTHV